MKVIDVLELMNDYDRIRIHASCDLDWNEDNPHTLEAMKVRELGWLFVQKLAARSVVEIASDTVCINGDGDTESCLTLVYR